MFFTVETSEGTAAVHEETFFAAVKRHVVHGDPCAEYTGYVWPEDAPIGIGWTLNASKRYVTAAQCWDALQELHDRTWGS